ncbi:MAG: hypothetical protein A4E43_00319 [Methanosaeta sp. PtaB.Bin005]|nr:MAG: hypothetical protein A4E43_00319 [Methanosaeta sp. PtaB.Bin005]
MLQMAIRVLSTKLFQNPGDLLYLACGGQFRKDRAPGVEYYAKFIADLQALPDPGGYTPYARGHLIGGLIKLSFQVQEDFVHHIRLQQPPQPVGVESRGLKPTGQLKASSQAKQPMTGL